MLSFRKLPPGPEAEYRTTRDPGPQPPVAPDTAGPNALRHRLRAADATYSYTIFIYPYDNDRRVLAGDLSMIAQNVDSYPLSVIRALSQIVHNIIITTNDYESLLFCSFSSFNLVNLLPRSPSRQYLQFHSRPLWFGTIRTESVIYCSHNCCCCFCFWYVFST